MLRTLLLVYLSLLYYYPSTSAIQIVSQRRTARPSSQGFTASVQSPNNSAGNIGVTNVQNIVYVANVTIGGIDLPVQLDTGSDDLWVLPTTPIPNLNTSIGVTLKEVYGSGTVFGRVAFAPVSLGSYSVESQAFINGINVTVFNESLFPLGIRGIMGLGFGTEITSPIARVVNQTTGNPTAGQSFLFNSFAQNPTLPNFLSVLLGRTDDQEATANGIFSISEYIESYEEVANAPKVQQFLSDELPASAGQWTFLVDEFKINGISFPLNSSIPGVPSGKVLALLDTGTSEALLPPVFSNGIYGKVVGGAFSETLSKWVVPCSSPLPNVTITIGGEEFFVNPLDLTDITTVVDDDGQNRTLCLGTYGPMEVDPEELRVDIILGDSFMRNIYAVFNYGSVGGASGFQVENASVQLLSVTEPNAALQDYNQTRTKNLENYPPLLSGYQIQKIVAQDNANSSSDHSDETVSSSESSAQTSGSLLSDSDSTLSDITKYGYIIIGLLSGNILVGLALFAIMLAVCIRRGGRARQLKQSYAPVAFKDAEAAPRAEDEVLAARYSD